jgi:type 1 glutamine amidotransferase
MKQAFSSGSKLLRRVLLGGIMLLCATFLFLSGPKTVAAEKQSAFKVLVFYSTDVEPDHVHTANDALAFYRELAAKSNFTLDATTDWGKLNESDLRPYRLILWLNNFPQTPQQRAAFEKYIEHGGGWIGFHVAGYNDKSTNWPWFVDFLGGAVFDSNNWPPLPAKLKIDDLTHPVTKGLPESYSAPANEWYLWKPSPRLSKNVRVLVTLDPSNYPIGIKDVISGGDLPVVWTNTKYRMLYMNMGHGKNGERIYSDPVQNVLFANAILWLGISK